MTHEPWRHPETNPDDPWPVSSAGTVAFVRAAWRAHGRPRTPAAGSAAGPRLLDIGAGQGRAAAALAAAGFAVVALEPDAGSAAHARTRGLSVIEEDVTRWSPGTESAGFDVVLFGRSLHHVPDLDRALRVARAALAPQGLVVLEEFAHDEADAATAAWFYERFDAGVATGRLRPREGPPPPDEPLDRWQAQFAHEPPLHGGRALLEGLSRIIAPPVAAERVPYLYRWFEQRSVAPDPDGVRAVQAAERAAIAAGSIRPIGLRAVARPADAARGTAGIAGAA